MTAEPSVYDAVAAHSFVHAPRDGLHLWQFWHWFILGDGARCAALGVTLGHYTEFIP
jgi:hypothetical protein